MNASWTPSHIDIGMIRICVGFFQCLIVAIRREFHFSTFTSFRSFSPYLNHKIMLFSWIPNLDKIRLWGKLGMNGRSDTFSMSRGWSRQRRQRRWRISRIFPWACLFSTFLVCAGYHLLPLLLIFPPTPTALRYHEQQWWPEGRSAFHSAQYLPSHLKLSYLHLGIVFLRGQRRKSSFPRLGTSGSRGRISRKTAG